MVVGMAGRQETDCHPVCNLLITQHFCRLHLTTWHCKDDAFAHMQTELFWKCRNAGQDITLSTDINTLYYNCNLSLDHV